MIALANLHPLQKDEMDSFMFQTVGWNVISSYAECLGLPLFRETLAGGSVHRNLTYQPTNAVASGAILSNYQRNRVENVFVLSLFVCFYY